MCGICGQYDVEGISVPALHGMARTMRHRGPDDEGFFVDGTVGLANRRLSIIDLSTGKQPIANEDGTIHIVCNGEIYNYPELRAQLIERGHEFHTHTDVETILHLYEEMGTECVKHLRGMFAFAIWDAPRQRLVLARDPMGQKQLYYTWQDGTFAFASESKALFEGTGLVPELNVSAMHHFISLRYIPGSATLFQGVHKLAAGHILVLKDGELTTERYWDLQYEPKLQAPEREIVSRLGELLLDTVESHMLSDVPVGAFLSGGIDSSLITAMMATQSSTSIPTFSIGVKEEDFNELPFARTVAEQYNTEHHELIVEPDLVAALPDMIWHMEEPVDPFAFGVYSVARLASQHVKVVLGGDGGDEMFAGYDRYLGNQLVDLYCMLPAPLRDHVIEPLVNRLPDNFSYNNRVQKLRWLVAMARTEAGERYAASASYLRFGHVHKQALYSPELWAELGGEASTLHLVDHYRASNASDPVDRMLYTDVQTRLADHLLVVVDRMTMAHSLESRSPYVDVRVVEFVATLPARQKLRGRRLKHALREVSREYLPEPLVERPKKGFGFPLAYWFRHELRELLRYVFQHSRLAENGYFQQQELMNLLEEHATGAVDHNYRLWLLLNLELWYRMFIDGESQDGLRAFLAEAAEAELA